MSYFHDFEKPHHSLRSDPVKSSSHLTSRRKPEITGKFIGYSISTVWLYSKPTELSRKTGPLLMYHPSQYYLCHPAGRVYKVVSSVRGLLPNRSVRYAVCSDNNKLRFALIIAVYSYGPGVDSASNRNEYQEYFLGVKAAGA